MSDVTGITTPIRLEYTFTPGVATSRFLNAIAQKRIIGERCPQCKQVYVPPHGSCPRCGVATSEEVPLPDTGIVTTFCIVNIPFAGSVPVPYVSAHVLLDGADLPLMTLVQEVDVNEVAMGMRVRAVWADEIGPTMTSIKYFAPIKESE
ncbi:MAG: Zn-ribbon domain-containing OB-fold protein [Actinomycetota bacterium]